LRAASEAGLPLLWKTYPLFRWDQGGKICRRRRTESLKSSVIAVGLAVGRRTTMNAEEQRLTEDSARAKNWKRWGPYLAERQWATVREDYSPDGQCCDYFTHDHARSRAYRWGEDGLLGITDRECRLC